MRHCFGLHCVTIKGLKFWTHASDSMQARFNAQWQYDKRLTKVILATLMLKGCLKIDCSKLKQNNNKGVI